MSLPADFGTGTVTGHWVTSRGLNGRGQVVFTPRANFMVSGATETVVLPTPVVATLRDGAISVVLPATDDADITPVDWTWKVECNIDGLDIAAFDITVPEGSTQDLSTVVEVDPGTGTTITTGPPGPPGPTGPTGPTGPAGPQPDLSDDPPEALGVASPGVDAEASRSDHVHPLPSPGDVGAATAAQGSLADSAVQPGDLATVATSGDYDDLSNKPTIPPAAPVDSVNGETGVVVLDAGDVGAVPVTAVGLLPGETNRGTWDVAETYAVGDVVAASGSVYVASAASTGLDPASNPGWDGIVDRRIELGPAATSGDYGLSVGYGATSGEGGLSVGYGATSGEGGTSVGPAATSGDYGVNIANIYTGTLDPGDPTTPTGATITTGFVDLPETADASNPAADHQRLIARTDGLYVRDETGAEVGPLGAGGGGGIPETIIDAAGDLIVGTAADTAGRLALGAAGTVLTSNGTTAGWGAVPAPARYHSNEWYLLTRGPGQSLPSSASFVPGANTLTASLVEVVEPTTITGHWLYLQAAGAAGSKVRVALYAVSTSTGGPTGTPVLQGPEIDASSTAYKQDTFTAVALAPGFWWQVVACSAAAVGWRGPANPLIDLGHDSGGVVAVQSLTASWPYDGAGMPDVTATSWSKSTALAAPYVRYRTTRP